MLLSVLRVLVFLRWVVHHFIIKVAELFKHIDEHHALLFHVGLVSVSNEIHVDATSVSSGALPGLFPLLLVVEGLFFVEVIEVLVADLAGDRRLIGSDLGP